MRFLKPGFPVAALALTLLSSAAWCEEPGQKTQLIGKIHVELKDLNLNRPADARTLLDRLRQAAWTACGGDPKLHDSYRTRPEQTLRVYEECRENAVKRAIDQIGAPLLVQAYAEEQQRGATAANANDCIDRDSRVAAARPRDPSGT
jgi:UrcA family protein